MPRSGSSCRDRSRSEVSGAYPPPGKETKPPGAELNPLTGRRQEKSATATEGVAEALGWAREVAPGRLDAWAGPTAWPALPHADCRASAMRSSARSARRRGSRAGVEGALLRRTRVTG